MKSGGRKPNRTIDQNYALQIYGNDDGFEGQTGVKKICPLTPRHFPTKHVFNPSVEIVKRLFNNPEL